MKVFFIGLFIFVSLFQIVHSDAASIVNQIDQTAADKQIIENSIDAKFLGISQETNTLKLASSALLQAKINTASSYGNFFNENLQCRELNITRNITKIAQDALDGKCADAPISQQVEDIYKQYIRLEFLQNLVTYYQKLFDQQFGYYTDYFDQAAVYFNFTLISFQSLRKAVTKYDECLEAHNYTVNLQPPPPPQCAEQFAIVTNKSDVFNNFQGAAQSFGRLGKFPIIDLSNKNESLNNATRDLQQLEAFLESKINQLNSKINICQSNTAHYLYLANQSLKSALDAKNKLVAQKQVIQEKLQDIKSLISQLKAKTSSINSLAGNLKQALP